MDATHFPVSCPGWPSRRARRNPSVVVAGLLLGTVVTASGCEDIGTGARASADQGADQSVEADVASDPGTDASPEIRILSAHLEGDPVFYRREGDLWMNTWAADGHLYMGWGDGSGRGDCCLSFGDGPSPNTPTCQPVPATESLEDIYHVWSPEVCQTNDYCYCRFTDAGLLVFHEAPLTPSSCQADCILSLHVPNGRSPVDDVSDNLDRSDKPSSLLYVDDTLYWAGHYPLGEPTHGYIAYSDDDGQSWTEVDGAPWTEDTPFRVMMFINMGRAYELNSDGYAYALAMGTETEWQVHGTRWGDGPIFLARVPTDRIADYESYTYLRGVDDEDQPQWSVSIDEARPVPGLRSYMQGSAIFHPGTARYLFLTAVPGALYSAPDPWGPWRLVSPILGDDSLPANWPGGGYIPGLIAKGAGPDHVYFTISGVDGIKHYQLTMGMIRFVLAGTTDVGDDPA